MIRYLAMAYDQDNVPRAWATAETEADAISECELQLSEYITAKSPRWRISRSDFHITIQELEPVLTCELDPSIFN